MTDLIIIFGPHASGKMTVGHELEKTTDFKLFHNHMTIELVRPLFGYHDQTGRRLVDLFRKEIFGLTETVESEQTISLTESIHFLRLTITEEGSFMIYQNGVQMIVPKLIYKLEKIDEELALSELKDTRLIK